MITKGYCANCGDWSDKLIQIYYKEVQQNEDWCEKCLAHS